jgi:phage shock protein C
MKRLRKTGDRIIFGVCGALGAFFGIDPTLFRVAFVVASVVYGTGLLLYLILAIVIPARDSYGA